VAAWNEAAHIDDHLDTFLALSYPDKELIIAAGGGDGTLDLARRWAGPTITILEQYPGEGKQRALARCLEAAKGAVIMLTDADCAFGDDAFHRLLQPIANGRAAVTTGMSEPKVDQRRSPLVQYQWFGDVLWGAQRPEVADGILGRNCALRREVIDQIGGFSAPARTGTDYVMSQLLRQGRHRIRAVPESRILTDFPTSPVAYLRMWRRWNKNLLIHGSRFGAWGEVKAVVLALGVAGAVFTAPLLALLAGPLALSVAALLLAFAVTGRVRRLAIGARLVGAPLSVALLVRIPFFTLLDMLGVVLAWADVMRPSRRARW
jgi:glycosyltransferase involved in cell wall biosynthesis